MNFSLLDYLKMLHPARVELFHSEMKECINEDSVVVDLGAGFGHFAIYAAKLGAQKVFAIETNPLVKLCDKLARKNGVGDRVVAIHADSRTVKLPESANVLIADVRGSLPFFQDSLDVFAHACSNFLTPDCTILPTGDDILVCPVEYQSFRQRNLPVDFGRFGLDYSPLEALAISTPVRTSGREVRLLCEPMIWASLRHTPCGSSFDSRSPWFTVQDPGHLSGLLVWSKIRFPSGRTLDNSPTKQELPYGQTFFPFKESDLFVDSGQTIECQIKPQAIRKNTQWSWSASIDGSRSVENNSILSALLI